MVNWPCTFIACTLCGYHSLRRFIWNSVYRVNWIGNLKRCELICLVGFLESKVRERRVKFYLDCSDFIKVKNYMARGNCRCVRSGCQGIVLKAKLMRLVHDIKRTWQFAGSSHCDLILVFFSKTKSHGLPATFRKFKKLTVVKKIWHLKKILKFIWLWKDLTRW